MTYSCWLSVLSSLLCDRQHSQLLHHIDPLQTLLKLKCSTGLKSYSTTKNFKEHFDILVKIRLI